MIQKEEANAGRDRICRDPQNLVPAKRGTPPPYSASDITEAAMRREVQTIYRGASVYTRQWYDRAVCQEGVNWDNWIITWCLWHAFRYRDSRNTNSDALDGRRSRGSLSEAGNSQRSMEPSRSTQGEPVVYYRVSGEFSVFKPNKDCEKPLTMVGTHGGVYWDPVRNP